MALQLSPILSAPYQELDIAGNIGRGARAGALMASNAKAKKSEAELPGLLAKYKSGDQGVLGLIMQNSPETARLLMQMEENKSQAGFRNVQIQGMRQEQAAREMEMATAREERATEWYVTLDKNLDGVDSDEEKARHAMSILKLAKEDPAMQWPEAQQKIDNLMGFANSKDIKGLNEIVSIQAQIRTGNLKRSAKDMSGTEALVANVMSEAKASGKPVSYRDALAEVQGLGRKGFTSQDGAIVPREGLLTSTEALEKAGAKGKELRTPGQETADKEFAKEYTAWNASGGYSDVQKQLIQLNEAAESLESGKELTGAVRGAIPGVIRAGTNPEAVAVQERVEESVQRNLRSVLGSQFTEGEGEKLIKRAFNPQLEEAENAIRVRRLIRQIDKAAQAKDSASRYFEENGTLKGWKGKMPSFSDFNPDEPFKKEVIPEGVKPEVWEKMSPENKALFK